MRCSLLCLFATFVALAASALSPDDIHNVHVADRTRYVSDMASAMSLSARMQADSILQSIWSQTSAEPVVVILPSLEGEDANDFATRLFTEWGIGKSDRDNGVLLLISVADRKVVIRTGYGAEGILPDIVCARIIRNDMAPYFRDGNFDAGVIQGLNAIRMVMTSPEARAELMSAEANDSARNDDFFSIYFSACAIVGVVALLAVMFIYMSRRKQPTSKAYESLDRLRLGLLVGSFLSLGCVFPAYVLLVLLMRHVRLHKRLCPNCSARMYRVDEDNDNFYLTAAQDVEEKLDSVDYDVWLCPDCGETDIIPYVNPKTNYTVCPQCHGRTCTLVNRRTIVPATTSHQGRGVEEHVCLNCKYRYQTPYTIAKVVAPPVVIIPGGGSRFGGGGFGGGSFGGGSTGGGGASGGW